jgi:hypothetical protein
MADFNLESDPKLAEWLASLKSKVAEKASSGRSSEGSKSEIYLPVIDMSKKFYQNNNKTYPEMQGTISILPVSYKGERVTEISGILKCWCPANDDWSFGFSYKILPPDMYPEGPIRDRIIKCRSILNQLTKDKKISWKECKTQTISIILGYVIMHRNTKGDLISSNLFGGDTIVEHKNVPAIVLCPNGKVLGAVQSDLDMKPNPIPYAMACYSDGPLASRKGWMAIKFTNSPKSFGYDVSVTTELVNPIVMPDGILPKDFNEEDDQRIQLLKTVDPIYQVLDWHQRGKNGEYYNEESLTRLESYINWLTEQHKD